jgi:hypothetical protein
MGKPKAMDFIIGLFEASVKEAETKEKFIERLTSKGLIQDKS